MENENALTERVFNLVNYLKLGLIFFSLLFTRSINSKVIYLENVAEAKNVVFVLTCPKSGTNLLTCSLQAIVRKPIGQLKGRPNQNNIGIYHPIANKRLDLELVSSIPMFYRTHSPQHMYSTNSNLNKLILLVRNPKELLFRHGLVSCVEDLKDARVKKFLREYVNRFKFYENWHPLNRRLIFYEDLICDENEEILLELLDFIEEDPIFFDDYIRNKEDYLNKIYSHYCYQHQKKTGALTEQGASAKQGPKEFYYTIGKPQQLLKAIDKTLKKMAPLIWKKYLKRFRTDSELDLPAENK